MNKSITLAALMLLIGVGCKHEQMARSTPPAAPTASPAIVKDTTGRVICHIVSRHQTITVKSGEHGVIYSIRDAQGNLVLADATPEEFQRVDPQLYQQIQHYIAVQADGREAIEASGIAAPAPIPMADESRP